MKRLVDRFAVAANDCISLPELGRMLGDVCLELGFAHFALLHHASLSTSDSHLIRIDNYPGEWVEELTGTGLVAEDPVHLASRRTNAGFAWAELGAIVVLGTPQRAILEQSRRFGFDQGFTVPVNVPGEPSGSCSFAMRQGRALPTERLLCAELVGSHAFRAARRINRWSSRVERPHLSPRELQCLRLVALGKTDWEIARILGLSPETVRTYVKHARARYGVASRTQLAIHALHDAQISFDDAIPRRR